MITVGIYGGGPLYSGGQDLIDELRASGMTTVVAWALHVHETGDLVFNDTLIVSDGAYAGDAGWAAELASLKEAPTSVDRLRFSIGGGWPVQDFHVIQQLIAEQGTGSGSILYRNFAALRSAIPTIDGIDFDDEDLLDADTTVAFARMLHELAYEVTFCPYASPDYWVGCLRTLNTPTSNLVTGFNLQCYAGGSDNTPETWIAAVQAGMGPDFDAAGFVFPGLWCANTPPACAAGQCPSSITESFRTWKSTGIQGGWIWLLDDVLKCESSHSCSGGPMGVGAYAEAIASGLG